MTVLSGIPALVLAAALASPQGGPEAFDIVGKASAGANATGGITVTMSVQIDRYTPENERNKMSDALKFSGYPGFLNALRAAPQAGTLDVAGETFVIRWARDVPTATGRTISIVTDQPVAFVGSGRRGAKSTAGYEVAVIQLVLDKTGHGTGTMAAAARVKPGGDTGVRIDSYAEKPITLTATLRGAK